MGNMKNTIKTISINLFYKKGYFATSISDIAREAGIQKSSIYYHYSNKEEILFDILKTTMADLYENLEAQIKGVQGAEEKMRAAIQSHVIFHMERQKEVLISDSELRGLTADNYKRIIGTRDKYGRIFESLIKNGIKEGGFEDLDFKVVSYAILTMCTAVSMWFNTQGRLSKEQIAHIYSDFVLKGLEIRGIPS